MSSATARATLPGDWDIELFIRDRGTVYLCADSAGEDNPLAPLFSCIVIEIAHCASVMGRQMTFGRLSPGLAQYLDEVCQICPLPLPTILSDAGGRGIQVITVVHGLSALAARYGKHGAQTVMNTSGVKLWLAGSSEVKTLEMIRRLCGQPSDSSRVCLSDLTPRPSGRPAAWWVWRGRGGRRRWLGPMTSYAIAHLDEIEEFADAGCHYRPIRHHLGITAFGVTAWTARAAGDLVINEHDEDDPTADQELFLVLRGHAVFELDGDRVDAPAGTLVFAPPRTKRTASAKEEGTTIIALEGTPGKAYEARGWELWAPLAPLYQAGEYAEVADRLGALVAAAPQYPMLFFNLACCESLCGRTSDALDHLRHAIEMSQEFRDSAKDDSDLDPIRDEPAFKQLVSD